MNAGDSQKSLIIDTFSWTFHSLLNFNPAIPSTAWSSPSSTAEHKLVETSASIAKAQHSTGSSTTEDLQREMGKKMHYTHQTRHCKPMQSYAKLSYCSSTALSDRKQHTKRWVYRYQFAESLTTEVPHIPTLRYLFQHSVNTLCNCVRWQGKPQPLQKD